MWKNWTRKNYAKLESVIGIENSQKFIEKEFEDQKEKIKDLVKDNKIMFFENQILHNEFKALYLSQEQNKQKTSWSSIADHLLC